MEMVLIQDPSSTTGIPRDEAMDQEHPSHLLSPLFTSYLFQSLWGRPLSIYRSRPSPVLEEIAASS